MQASDSDDAPIDAFCTMATIECRHELALFFVSLRAHHTDTRVYVACSSELLNWVRQPLEQSSSPLERLVHSSLSIEFSLPQKSIFVPSLDKHGPIARSTMERRRGVFFPTAHADFMMEKANIMEYALCVEQLQAEQSPDGGATHAPLIVFLDCDICTLAPWPAAPASCNLLLSPHSIRRQDEAMWGVFNGGVVGVRQADALFQWRKYTMKSRFHDQASLEDLDEHFTKRRHLAASRGSSTAGASEVCYFGDHVNFGFWRMFQQEASPHHTAGENTSCLLSKFSLGWLHDAGGIQHTKMQSSSRGALGAVSTPSAAQHLLFYDDVPLQSVHTHFFNSGTSVTMPLFNRLLRKWMIMSRSGAYDHVLKFVMLAVK